MRREVGIPLLLWAAAAAWVHTMFGGGGYVVARLHDDQNDVLAFSGRVRERVKQPEQTVAVEWDEGNGDVQPAPGEPPPQPDPQHPKKEDVKKDAVVPEPQKPKEPEPPKPKPIPLFPAKEQPKPPPPPPEQLQPEKRIAVKQHAKPNQEDNPNAKQIAEDANHVEKETVATQTSHDQDDPNPTPAGQHAGAAGSVGNGDKTRIAESDEHKGEKNKAPGERGMEFDVQKEPRPLTASATPNQAKTNGAKSGGDGRPAGAAAQAPKSAQNPESSSSPDVQSANGGWTFKAFQPGTGAEAKANDTGSQGASAKGSQKASPTQWLGLGGTPGPGQINLNLNHSGVVASVGEAQLKKERVNDGERRLSQHRGSWQGSSLERWRSAIENYVATVKPGNQTALNAARSPFATYLNAIHLRIHPIFGETFLDSIENLPPTHPLSDKKLMSRLEIVLNPKDGSITRMGVAKPSGVTAFDLAALDSVQRASPFGPAPVAIVSTDGKVYLHWEFHRDESACTTANARPFMLNLPPAAAPGPGPQYPDSPKFPPNPESNQGSRQGALDAPPTIDGRTAASR